VAEFVRVAATGDVAPGQGRRFKVGSHAIALFNVDGDFYAIGDECTHETASLSEGTLEGYQVRCPRHGARFDIRTGKHLRFPAVVPVRSYEVRIEGDEVLVAVP
jgi:3-phenylpropionate/trans-cinnamate dioxygenase ferredoxin subunit